MTEYRCPACNSRWFPAISCEPMGKKYLVVRQCQHCGKEARQTEESEVKVEKQVEWRRV